jgi:sporulation protein YlmC with PRC-barrel domain/uncharacterized membrane protein YkoI
MLLSSPVWAQTGAGQREQTGQPRAPERDQSEQNKDRANNPNVQRWMAILESSNVSLADAIRKAEQHSNGKAVAARLTTGNQEMPGRSREHEMRAGERETDTGRPGATGAPRDREPGAAEPPGTPPDRMRTDTEVTAQQGAFEIFCLANGRIMEVRVDCKTGNVLGENERQTIPFMMGISAAGPTGERHFASGAGERQDRPVAKSGATGFGAAPTRIQKASDLMDKDLKGQGGEDLGDIKDFAVDAERGRATFAIVDLGDVEGMKGKTIAVPFSALTLPSDAKNFVLAIDRERLRGAPTIDKGKINNMDVGLANQIYGHFNEPAYWQSDALARRSAGSGRTTDIDRDTGTLRIQKASDLMSKNLKNPAGDKLGDIKDLAIDPDQGRVVYAIVAAGLISGKHLAIPYSALSLPSDAKSFVIDMSEERFKSAPSFERDQWPNMTDRNWSNDIHSFYGVRPDWEEDGVRRTTDVDRDREHERDHDRGHRP